MRPKSEPAPEHSPPANFELQSSSSSIVQHQRSQQKKQPWILAMGSLLMIIASIGLAYFLWNTGALKTFDDPKEKRRAELKQAIDDARNSAENETDATTEIATETAKKDSPKTATNLEPKPKPRIISESKLKSIWTSARPYIVKLYAKTPSGSRTLTGVIIDSRGWIVTSYRAVQGAREITVSQSSRDIIKYGESELLSDKVKGIVASDVENDIVVLSINRRIVTKINDLPTLTKNNLLGSMYVAQCVAPTEKYPWASTECRIETRKRLGDFSEANQKALQDDNLKDEKTNWVIHENKSPQHLGAALITQEGKLAAINVLSPRYSRNEPKHVIAVPIELVLNVVKEPNDPPANLPLPSVKLLNQNPTSAAPNQLPVLHDNSSNYEMSIALNKAGEECETSNWRDPTALLSLVDRLYAVDQNLTRDNIGDDEKKTLSKQFQFWSSQLYDSINSSNDSLELKQDFNRKTASRIPDKNANFLAFAKVLIPASASPRIDTENRKSTDTVTLDVLGTDHRVIAPLNPDWKPLLPDSLWLIAGESKGRPIQIKHDGTEVSSVLSDIKMLIEAF